MKFIIFSGLSILTLINVLVTRSLFIGGGTDDRTASPIVYWSVCFLLAAVALACLVASFIF
jgi:hypothetical protein